MPNRFDGRLKKLEAMQGDDVESILDGLSHEQSHALLAFLMALLEGEEGPSDERLRGSYLSRDRFAAALASIPDGTVERLLAGFLERVATRKEAA
jgi:hypothetical protein